MVQHQANPACTASFFSNRTVLSTFQIMNRSKPRPANSFTGTLETGPRGPILRDGDGVRWRLSFANGVSPDGLSGRVSVRGRLAAPDRIEVDYVAPHDDEI